LFVFVIVVNFVYPNDYMGKKKATKKKEAYENYKVCESFQKKKGTNQKN